MKRVIDIAVEREENVYPMVPPGATFAEIIEGPEEKTKAITDSTKRPVSNI